MYTARSIDCMEDETLNVKLQLKMKSENGLTSSPSLL
jgi:hypothetical protein